VTSHSDAGFPVFEFSQTIGFGPGQDDVCADGAGPPVMASPANTSATAADAVRSGLISALFMPMTTRFAAVGFDKPPGGG